MAEAPVRKPDSLSTLSTGPDARVLVVGLGISGLWSARWLAQQGARVTVSDMKPASELDPAILKELREIGADVETGGHRGKTFLDADTIVVSPGVPQDMPLIRSASEKHIPVIGEMELASLVIQTPIIAITGTNGKTTVTAFVGELLKNAGMNVFVGGNIGTPLMAYVAGKQDADYLVVEVSSFQLDTVETFSPFISVILNITPDHLERYADVDAYARSKLRICENQGAGQYAILNDDDRRLAAFDSPPGVTPLRYGLVQRQGIAAFLDGATAKAGIGREATHCFSMERFALPGIHNRENLLAAILVGIVLEIDDAVIQGTIDRFKGLPHRIEYVREVNGIRFFDDSKATNVDAARRAIASFDDPIILIAGGRHKGADYGPLVDAGRGRMKGAVFLGEARDLLAKAFEQVVPYTVVGGMNEAVAAAFAMAEPGDVVLLAPACSSFDMFSDYGQRGDVFKDSVKGLIHG